MKSNGKKEIRRVSILASKGYPQKAQTGDIINGLDKAEAIEDIKIFHAGTSKNADNEISSQQAEEFWA